MDHLSEYRDGTRVRGVLDKIHRVVTKPWTLMEVCGGQTHSIIRYGLDRLLPEGVTLVHGPGCPVCVTPVETIDTALSLAARDDVVFATFGDMLRVPGSFGVDGETHDLMRVRSAGGDVRVVVSPLEAVALAKTEPDRTVVFFGIGFETTAPANAMAVLEAQRMGLANFCLLSSHVTVPPAICAVMDAPDCRVNGFLAAGHVCTVMGTREYEPLTSRYRVPIVVTGFEPLDLAHGILKAVEQLESGAARVENAYARTAPTDGNPHARKAMDTVYEVCDRPWRGLGIIPMSGLRIRESLADFDAERRFGSVDVSHVPQPPCRAGEVLRGVLKPDLCPSFGTVCTPQTPLGATMVSSEGACAAYYRYGRAS